MGEAYSKNLLMLGKWRQPHLLMVQKSLKSPQIPETLVSEPDCTVVKTEYNDSITAWILYMEQSQKLFFSYNCNRV